MMGLANQPGGLERKFNYGDWRGPCKHCKGSKGRVELIYIGYAANEPDEPLLLCRFCALQLARMILEDTCDLAGDRHG